MSKVLITRSKLDNLANTISAKSGVALPLTIAQMDTAVDSIVVGSGVDTSSDTVDAAHLLDGYTAHDSTGAQITGSYVAPAPNLQAKTNIDPSTSSQTIQADSGYDGLSSVQINAMPSGAVSASATKGSVSNHAVSVTPTATVGTAGYLAAGSTNGTAVSVSASELVSGTYTVDSSGTKDVTNYANVSVPAMTLPTAASGTSSGTSKATITPTSSAQYLNIPTGYNDTAQYYTIAAASGGSVTIKTTTMTNNSATATQIQFTSLTGQPKAFFCRCTSNLSRSSSNRYYYIADIRWDGSSTGGVVGNKYYVYNGQYSNQTTGYSQSYSSGTLTLTTTGSQTASPGSFYNGTYELVYVY